jgi:predicted AAA+ superfamily ATPase
MLLERGDYRVSYIIAEELTKHLKYYLYIGGMPKVVQSYLDSQNLEEVRELQRDIIANFEQDFSKHIPLAAIPKVGMIWNSIPLQLAREKKQWIYNTLKAGARASQYKDALNWLLKVGLVYQVNRVETPALPLATYAAEAFKLYMVDVGLLSAMAGLSIQNLVGPDPEVFHHFHGALIEQYVLQELKVLASRPGIFYWANDRNKGLAEVDFVIQHEGEIIPIEVKASTNLQAKSLKTYINYYQPRWAIRTSLGLYGRNGKLWDIPLYLIGQLPEIVATSSSNS